MYLAKYLICAFIYAAALLFAIRTCSTTSLRVWRGKLARGVLTGLVFAGTVVVWYYASPENFDMKWFIWTARIASSMLFAVLLPDIWADRATEQPVEEAVAEPVVSAENDTENKTPNPNCQSNVGEA